MESEKKVHVVPPKPNEFSDPPWFNSNRQNSWWTDADDATLLRMIGSNFAWPMIAAALGRQVNEVESRWNQIRPDRMANNNGNGDQQKAGGKQDKSDAKKGGPKVCGTSVLLFYFVTRYLRHRSLKLHNGCLLSLTQTKKYQHRLTTLRPRRRAP